jgi:hypothetical protein
MKASMQGKGRAAPDQEPSPSVNMANLTRLSVLIGETDDDRGREIVGLTRALGVRRVIRVDSPKALLHALRTEAFDLLICAEQLGGDDAVGVLPRARKLAPATRTVVMGRSNGAAAFAAHDIEAIELPFSRLTLHGLLHRTASSQGGLWCEVPELSLSDILQMYHQARRSITVLLSGPVAGRVGIDAGEIVDAEADEERGVLALSRLLEAESGLIRTEPLRAGAMHTIAAPFQSVILEAAHRLDERRRDSRIGHPSSSSSNTISSHAPTAGDAGDDRLGQQTTSASSAALGPAMTPMLPAPAPNPESFLAPSRRSRRSTLVAVISLLGSVCFVAVAALYLRDQLDLSAPRTSSDPGAPAVLEPPRRSTSEQPATKRAPAARETFEPSRPESPSAGNVADPPLIQEQPATAPSAPPGAEPPARASSFQLHITSKPSRATVSEAGRMLGKTPLTLNIDARSVANAPREFIVRLPGYVSARISRAASKSNVNAAVVLAPRAPLLDSPDAGTFEDDLEAARPESPRPGRKEFGIRLRR